MADYPPYDQHDFPAARAARASRCGQSVDLEIGAPWPTAATPSFHWEWLIDPENGSGEAFDRQYWRANVDPLRALRHVGGQLDSTARTETKRLRQPVPGR
ncbi:MAG: hypothetical protein R3F01_03455 [Lysobacteraceae bacterium]